MELAEDIVILLDAIKINLKNSSKKNDKNISKKIQLISKNQEAMGVYNLQFINVLNETFGYVHAEDELSIIQYLTLSQKILLRGLDELLTLDNVDAAITCFKGLCTLLNLIKSRSRLSICEIKQGLDFIPLNSALEILFPTIVEYKDKEKKYRF